MNAVHTRTKAIAHDAFTLVEMIVVIGIIVLLASLLVPMVSKSISHASRAKTLADLNTISAGLDAYKLDHKDFPRADLNGTTNGAVLLCWALVAPGPAQADGADGPGFRLRGTQGQTYGPYINVSNFRLVDVNTKGNANPNLITADQNIAIADRYGTPIYYCPANVTFDPPPKGTLLSDTGTPKYSFLYLAASGMTVSAAQAELADSHTTDTPLFILWSAGPNAVFGMDPGKNVSDDVTNFRN